MFQETEIDTIFSCGNKSPWVVEVDKRFLAGGSQWRVMADSADHACEYICRTRWISKLGLRAHQDLTTPTEDKKRGVL